MCCRRMSQHAVTIYFHMNKVPQKSSLYWKMLKFLKVVLKVSSALAFVKLTNTKYVHVKIKWSSFLRVSFPGHLIFFLQFSLAGKITWFNSSRLFVWFLKVPSLCLKPPEKQEPLGGISVKNHEKGHVLSLIIFSIYL